MEGKCRRHPGHRQSKGVCPSCLRERLSKISATVSAASSTNTNSSPYSSRATPSSCGGSSTPGRSGRRESKLKRSMSIACVLGIDARGRGAREKKGERGFWWRLLGMEWRAKKERVKEGKMVLHSRTVKDTSSARWFF